MKKQFSKSSISLTVILLGAFASTLLFLRAADNDQIPLPAIVKAGLAVFASGGAEPAMSVWRKGGPAAGERVLAEQLEDLIDLVKPLGNYRSYEVIDTKEITRSVKLIYLAMNFERGAAYARFQVYHANKDWIVQHVDFDAKPWALMPWLDSAAASR